MLHGGCRRTEVQLREQLTESRDEIIRLRDYLQRVLETGAARERELLDRVLDRVPGSSRRLRPQETAGMGGIEGNPDVVDRTFRAEPVRDYTARSAPTPEPPLIMRGSQLDSRLMGRARPRHSQPVAVGTEDDLTQTIDAPGLDPSN